MGNRAIAALVLASTTIAAPVSADPPAPVEVTVRGAGRVRVQISEGITTPCDATTNRPLFDGWADGGETLRGTTSADCVCVRSTSARFPRAGWSLSGLACRPRICRHRVCRPAPDPTIRVVLDTGS